MTKEIKEWDLAQRSVGWFLICSNWPHYSFKQGSYSNQMASFLILKMKSYTVIAIGQLGVNVGLRFRGLLSCSASDPGPHFKVEKHFCFITFTR